VSALLTKDDFLPSLGEFFVIYEDTARDIADSFGKACKELSQLTSGTLARLLDLDIVRRRPDGVYLYRFFVPLCLVIVFELNDLQPTLLLVMVDPDDVSAE
jgi:hypothetical protein